VRDLRGQKIGDRNQSTKNKYEAKRDQALHEDEIPESGTSNSDYEKDKTESQYSEVKPSKEESLSKYSSKKESIKEFVKESVKESEKTESVKNFGKSKEFNIR
jgi:hypothetical protein